MSDRLNVFSFNCWGLAFVSKNRKSRIKAIAEYLSKQNYDIVTLQEVWVSKDYELLKEALPYSKYFYSGVLGSGLVILSKLPIISTHYYPFTLNGKPLKIFHGDYYVGKGVASALVQHPGLGFLEIFNTHLHAGYGPKDKYKAHRATECWQLAHLLRQSAAMNRHIILSGDFNSVPHTFNYQIITQHGFMTDSWLKTHHEPDPNYFDIEQLTSNSYTQYFGYTCNSPFNSFSRYYKESLENAKQLRGKRLDYIFYRSTPSMTCISSQVVLTDFIPNTNQSYSDHFAVLSVFDLSLQTTPKTGIAPLQANLAHPNYSAISTSILDEILQTIETDITRSKKEGRKYTLLSAFFLLLSLILYLLLVTLSAKNQSNQAISLWLPLIVGISLSLTCSLTPICLIVGFIFGQAEKSALLEFYNQIQLFKNNKLSI